MHPSSPSHLHCLYLLEFRRINHKRNRWKRLPAPCTSSIKLHKRISTIKAWSSAGPSDGFSHEKTAHHFRLYADGGAIEAEANDAQDTASRDAIRAHLGHIATMFAAGEFSAPMLIHEQNPPGTEEMKRLRDAIQYNLENTERGARLRISTKNAEALQGVRKFLRFQIADHQTGDTPEITKVP